MPCLRNMIPLFNYREAYLARSPISECDRSAPSTFQKLYSTQLKQCRPLVNTNVLIYPLNAAYSILLNPDTIRRSSITYCSTNSNVNVFLLSIILEIPPCKPTRLNKPTSDISTLIISKGIAISIALIHTPHLKSTLCYILQLLTIIKY